MIKDKSRSYSASKSEPIILQNLLAAIKYRHLAQFAAVDQNITDEQIQVNTAIVRRQVWREMKGRERGGGGAEEPYMYLTLKQKTFSLIGNR